MLPLEEGSGASQTYGLSPMTTIPLHEDLLTGATAIASHLGWPVRRVYYFHAREYLPIKSVGALLVARKSELDAALSTSKSTEAA